MIHKDSDDIQQHIFCLQYFLCIYFSIALTNVCADITCSFLCVLFHHLKIFVLNTMPNTYLLNVRVFVELIFIYQINTPTNILA